MKKLSGLSIFQRVLLTVAIFCSLSIGLFAISIIDKTVFVILRHVRNESDDILWRRCYTSIRQFYLTIPIIIIDDNSRIDLSYDGLDNTIIIKSKHPGAAELLPYYYFLKYKWAAKMIVLHDSMFLKRPFTDSELNHPIKFHWFFSVHLWDDDIRIDNLLVKLKNANKLINYNHQKALWHGCFGVASIVDLSILEKIERKYLLTSSLVNAIKSRDDRMALERIFGLIMFKEGYVTLADCSNFGCIHDYPRNWQPVDDKFLNYLKSKYPGAILKTWHGR